VLNDDHITMAGNLFYSFHMNTKEQDTLKKIAEQAGKKLIEYGQSIAVAESVTAGHLQVAFSLAEKALDFFQGGITTYNVGQKTRHLRVDPIHGIACNCVSEKVAETMTRNVAELFACDWGIGITGYASPVPEEGIDQLFACFAISFQGDIILSQTITAGKNDPVVVRQYYTSQVLQALLKLLKKKG
jgi:nicotinamide-nucleotide amidase